MTARNRNALASSIATLTIGIAVALASPEASAMSFGGLGRGMPTTSPAAPAMNHVGPSLPMASHVGPTLPASNHVGPALPMMNRTGSLPTTTHLAPVTGHSLPTTNVARINTMPVSRDVRPPSTTARTDGLSRPTTVQTDRRIATNHVGGQPNAGTVGTTPSVKPGSVDRPNLAKVDHIGNAGVVKQDAPVVRSDTPVVKSDVPAVVKNDAGGDGDKYRFRDLLGKSRFVTVQLSDGAYMNVFCRNDGEIGISCHAPGFVMQFREDKNGELHLIKTPPAKKPAQPSFISLYDPDTNTTTTRTFNPDGTHTDVVETGNTVNNH